MRMTTTKTMRTLKMRMNGMTSVFGSALPHLPYSFPLPLDDYDAKIIPSLL